MRKLVAIQAYGDFCVLATKVRISFTSHTCSCDLPYVAVWLHLPDITITTRKHHEQQGMHSQWPERLLCCQVVVLTLLMAWSDILTFLQGENPGEYILILCNAIGSPVDSKYIEVEPKYLYITNHHVIAASDDTVYVWQFRTSFSKVGFVTIWHNVFQL